jgi:DNA uptake protein ComE-like DNA-binding protein
VLLTPSQQRGVTVLLAILLVILFVRLLLNSQTAPYPTTAPGPVSDQLADRIDPNTATVAELASIPDLGEKRAADIVQFRDQYVAKHPNRPAFRKLSDLEQIRGIGPGIADDMEPYLKFPALQQ